MKRTTLKPLGTRKQAKLLALMKEALESAALTNAEFGQITRSGPFPTSERQVTKFIRDRVSLHHQSWIIRPLKDAMELIRKNGNEDSK